MEPILLTLNFEIKEIDEDAGLNVGRIVGLSAAFNNLDSYNERIIPGAFEKTMKPV